VSVSIARHQVVWRARLTFLGALVAAASITLHGWGTQGHRLVARIAENHLTTNARRAVRGLIGSEPMADVASWADQHHEGNTQSWHYVNIPADAGAYDRNRDCPVQGGIDSRGGRWRDCVVDRILYNQQRLADRSLGRGDRATALKFLIHLVADVHQPFHAFAADRGGNAVEVTAFGSPLCGARGDLTCTLHGVWDGTLLAHRHLNDGKYVDGLETLIRDRRLDLKAGGSPADWARESHDLARAALVPNHGVIDETYYRRSIAVVDERLAVAGLRLAKLLNETLDR
jgi:hypothetical protein